MTVAEWIELLLAIGVALGGGGALIAFWTWARGRINKLDAEVAVLKAWRHTIEVRCRDRRDDIRAIFERIDEVKDVVSEKAAETAAAIGRLEGKLSLGEQS